MQPTSWNAITWVAQNWTYLAGWTALFMLLYRLFIAANRLTRYGTSIDTLTSDMEAIKTNHLPHIQSELEKANESLTGLRLDVRDGLSRLSDNINVVLTRMP